MNDDVARAAVDELNNLGLLCNPDSRMQKPWDMLNEAALIVAKHANEYMRFLETEVAKVKTGQCPNCNATVRPLHCCACEGCDGCREAAEPPAVTEAGEQEYRHRKLTHADDQRLQEAFDALPECPTEEEAEAVLKLCGTSGKDVVNGFIEQLLQERSEMQIELDKLRAAALRTSVGEKTDRE